MQQALLQNKSNLKTSELPLNLILTVQLHPKVQSNFFTLLKDGQLTIGRRDPSKAWQPDVDFTEYGGQLLGVSRLHAAIKQHKYKLYIIDLFSHNGTFVNEEMLFPHKPQLLRSWDTIRIGHIKFQLDVYKPQAEMLEYCVIGND